MSMFHIEIVNCPSCGNSQKTKVYSSINVTEDASLKNNVLSNEFNLFVCEKCNNSYPIMNNFIYHDMNKEYMILLSKAKDDNQIPASIGIALDNYRLRIVSDRNELIEKILIFDDSLSDVLVELLKILTFELGKDLKEFDALYYNGIKKGILGRKLITFLRFKNDYIQEHKLNVRKTPEELINKYNDPKLVPNCKWIIVDREYVYELLEAEGSIKKLQSITVHVLDPVKGYKTMQWQIDVDISQEMYKKFRDNESGDLYLLIVIEPIKSLEEEDIDNFDDLIDIINEKLDNASTRTELVTKRKWLEAKSHYDFLC